MVARKKIFLIWSGPQKDGAEAISKFEENGYDTVYWVGTDEEGIRIPGTVFHDRLPARKGIPAPGHSILDFPPPEASLLRKLYKTESAILTMMNRKVDTETHLFTLDEKKHRYYELVRYWDGILTKYQPDAIVSSLLPHNISNLILHSLARLKGIRTLFLCETWVSDRIIAQHDYEEEAPLLREAMAKNSGIRFKREDLSVDLREFYEKQTEPNHDATPVDVKLLSKRFSGISLALIRARIVLAGFFRPNLFLLRVRRFAQRLLGGNLKKEYARHVSPVDYHTKYVYVALHWQPEGSTSPLGEMFADQILMIEMLSYALPKGWVLYVKEHPFQWMIGGNTSYMNMRYRGYYEKIQALPNTKLIPIDMDTFALINSATAVATVTGRVALEGVLRGKPTLIFGYPWFMNAPGIFRVDSPRSIQKAFAAILSGEAPSEQELLKYFKSLDEASVRGYIDTLADRNSPLSIEESSENIREFLLRELQKLFSERKS